MLKNTDGQEISLGPGCVIGFCREHRYIVLMPDSDGFERILWKHGDDKLIAPKCICTDQDFFEVVCLIAATLGLRTSKRDEIEFNFGPAYRLVE